MNITRKTLCLLLGLPLLLLLSSCNKVENHSRSASMLIVQNILGKDASGTQSNFLQSDVLLTQATSGATVASDSATATFRVQPLDPAPIMGTSRYYDVTLERYTVSFTRTDGKNTPGVDVPYPFEGSLSVTCPSGANTSISFIIVREVAKLEPPLIALVDMGAEVVLSTTAKIDFYGHDLANNQVMATGYLAVYFANYAEAPPTPPSQTTASIR